ncbi:MAG TPA: ATP-dependent Clp protease proteolytic subunit, partial [Candidatus Nanoarchaeia archaeon]
SQVEKDTDRDFFMTSAESKKYGIIDAVIEARKTKLTAAAKMVPSTARRILEPENTIK